MPRLAASLKGQLAIAVASVFVVLCANLVWRDFFRIAPLLLYAACVAASSRFGGIRSGLAATVLSLAATAFLNEPPIGSFRVDAVQDRIHLAEFGAMSVLISYLSGRLHRHIRQAAAGEDRLQLFAEGVTDYGILSLDPEGRLISWNSTQERLTGYGADAVMGKHISVFFPSEEAKRGEPERFLHQAATSGSAVDEGLRVHKDGSRAWVYMAASAVRDSRGSLTGYTVVTHDMTRRRLEDERFRLALESSPNGMLLVDREGKIVLVNKQVEMIFGYAREELLGKMVEVLLPERARDHHRDLRQGYQGQPSTRRMGEGRSLFGSRKDGNEVPVEIGLTPIHTKEGDFVLASIIDISQRKKAEEQLRQTHEALEKRVLDLEEYSYTISHDLRAPLRAVEGFSRILLKKAAGRLGPDEQGLLERIAKAVSRMDHLIEDVLSFGRTAHKPVEITPVDLNFLLEDILARYPMPNATVRVLGSLAPVNGNEGLLTQILTNLLINAVKFVPIDRKPAVEIATEKRGDRVRLTVKDNGMGIPAAFREKIFKPFERIPGPIAQEGTGIGLAIVKKAAERMGGNVGVESEPTAWSKFWIDLPGVTA